MIDYKGIIDGLSADKIIFLLRSLGSEEYIEHEDYIQFKTICHNQDIESASMKLYYYKNTHLFVCYSNCGTMSIFTLMKHIYEERGIEYDEKNYGYNEGKIGIKIFTKSYWIALFMSRSPF